VAKKKNNKAIEKRRAKSKQEKQKKRHLKLVKEKHKEEADVYFPQTEPMADIKVPDGFRAVSMSQALMEFGKPLMKDADQDIKNLNEILNITGAIWNYVISLEKELVAGEREDLRKSIISNMKSAFKIDDNEAGELFQEMIERRRHLFPEAMQPKGSRMMFMRKELSHLIAPFNYDRLSYSMETIPPDEQDRSAIEKIKRMDRYIADGAE
jgi:hypothetical protein